MERELQKRVSTMRAYADRIPRSLDRALSLLIKAPARRNVKTNQLNGRLDTKRLASVKTGNRHVFKRQDEVQGTDTIILVIVDQTTSMFGNRISPSMAFASRIKAAAQRVGGKCVLAGMSNERFNMPQLRMYCKPTERVSDDTYQRMLDEVDGGGTSIAGVVLKGAQYLKSQTAERRVIVMITDGMEGTHAAEAGRLATAWGIDVIPIGIDCDVQMDDAVNIPRDTLSTKGLERVIKKLS